VDELIRGLLKQRGATLVAAPNAIGTPSIRCLGRLLVPPIGLVDEPAVADSLVWHAQDGWSPLDRVEIERWMVDAPVGSHWLLSEREVERVGRNPKRKDLELTIWNPKKLAAWVGEAVLAGDLSARPSGFVEPESTGISSSIERTFEEGERGASGFSESTMSESEFGAAELSNREAKLPDSMAGPRSRAAERLNLLGKNSEKIEAYRPTIQLKKWLEQNGFGVLKTTPVLIPARIWHVSGILRGPEDAAERRWWRVLEDPLSAEVSVFNGNEQLPSVPRLNIIEMVEWIGKDAVRLKLPELLEVRKHWESVDSGGSRLLHWWRLDPSSCEMTASRVLLPAWIVHIPTDGPHLLHGLTGQLISSSMMAV
jgi:hypothetical protein